MLCCTYFMNVRQQYFTGKRFAYRPGAEGRQEDMNHTIQVPIAAVISVSGVIGMLIGIIAGYVLACLGYESDH